MKRPTLGGNSASLNVSNIAQTYAGAHISLSGKKLGFSTMERSAMLTQSIIEFLDSGSSANNKLARCSCGALMQHQTTTFFYEGRSWEVELPVCIRCNKSASAPTDDAQSARCCAQPNLSETVRTLKGVI